jgi:hypothetical protein
MSTGERYEHIKTYAHIPNSVRFDSIRFDGNIGSDALEPAELDVPLNLSRLIGLVFINIKTSFLVPFANCLSTLRAPGRAARAPVLSGPRIILRGFAHGHLSFQ